VGRRRDSRVWVGGWTVDWTGEVGSVETRGRGRGGAVSSHRFELQLTARMICLTAQKGWLVGCAGPHFEPASAAPLGPCRAGHGRSKSSTRGLSPPIRHGHTFKGIYFLVLEKVSAFLTICRARESFEFGIYSAQLNSLFLNM
jgi:hypothetical protein